MPNRIKPYAFSGLSLLAFVTGIQAQTPPDAGTVQQQIERQLPKALPTERAPLRALPPEYKPAAGLTVTVKTFRFAGNTLLADVDLAPTVAAYLNRPLDFNGLQEAAAAVAEAYRRAGWLVRVYLPRQEIRDGLVTLQVVEGVFGTLRLDGKAPARFSPERAAAYVAAAQPAGKPINAAALDRAMLLLDDLPGITVSGNLVPGGGPAETDLLLKLADEPLAGGEAGLDNAGPRATGKYRFVANAQLNGPLGFGDQMTANLVHSQGNDYLRLGYSVPLGHDGLRVGASASTLDYRLVAPEFSALDAQGSSDTWGVEAQYPLIRGRTRNLYVVGGYEDKAFDNRANGAVASRYDMRNFNLGLVGNLFDTLGGGGANLLSLLFTAGRADLADSPNRATDAATTRIHGRFEKLRYLLSRQQTLTPDLALYAGLSGQFASRNLDSSEKFYLGGATGVRAYPANEGGGSEGTLLNLELRWRVRGDLVLTGFYDWGSIRINHDNNFAGAAMPNRYELDGAGVSLGWIGPGGINLKAAYARRLGDNPNPTATGKDQDGSLTRDRVWLLATLPF